MLGVRTWCRFKTTRWSLVNLAGRESNCGDLSAVDALSRNYYPPVYAYLRRAGKDPEQADELAQGFFTDVIVCRHLFERADRANGRLRDLILCALKNYLKDCHRREVVSGSDRTISSDSLEHEETFVRSMPDCDPSAAFERRFATMVLEEALRRCERHFVDGGMESHWSAYEARVLAPAFHAVNPVPLAELAKDLGFKRAANAAAAIQAVNIRAGVLIRQVLAESSPGADQIEEHRKFLDALVRVEGRVG